MKAMLQKELKEILRTYRWLLLPCVFLVLGLGQPIAFKLMPEILKNSLPPGTTLVMPPTAPMDVLKATLGQFNQMGVLMVILVVMGTVAQEKASGVAAAVLVKPVARGAYLAAKFFACSLLAAVAFWLGLGASAYYTQALIGPVDWQAAWSGGLVYLLYLLITVALAILASTLFSGQASAGGAALLGILALTLLPKLASWSERLFPGALIGQAEKIFAGKEPELLWQPLAFNAGLIVVLLTAAVLILKRQEL